MIYIWVYFHSIDLSSFAMLSKMDAFERHFQGVHLCEEGQNPNLVTFLTYCSLIMYFYVNVSSFKKSKVIICRVLNQLVNVNFPIILHMISSISSTE